RLTGEINFRLPPHSRLIVCLIERIDLSAPFVRASTLASSAIVCHRHHKCVCAPIFAPNSTAERVSASVCQWQQQLVTAVPITAHRVILLNWTTNCQTACWTMSLAPRGGC